MTPPEDTEDQGQDGKKALNAPGGSSLGNDPSNANNLRDLIHPEVNQRTGKLRLAVAAPVLPGIGGLDVDLGIEYMQSDGSPPRRVLGLPTNWQYRLSYIVGEQIVLNGQQSYTVGSRWARGMKYYNLQDMNLEAHNDQPPLPYDSSQRYLHVLVSLNGERQYFDLRGRLIARADAHGNHILFYYSDPDRDVYNTTLQRIVDTYGQDIQFDYPDNAIEITFPEGEGEPLRFAYECNPVGQLTAYRDPTGKRTTFTYDGGQMLRNLLSRIESPDKLVTTLSYSLIFSKGTTGERRLDVVSELNRTCQGAVRTTKFHFDPDGNKQNYTGYPTYILAGQDNLLESNNNRFRYVTTVDDGITLTRHTYNNLHLELQTDVYSSSLPGDLISTTLYTYPDEGPDQTFPAFNSLSPCYQLPKEVETRSYNPGDTQTFRARKTVNTYNDAGQVTSTSDYTASPGGAFEQEKVESTTFDPRFGQELEKDVSDYRAMGPLGVQPVVTRLARTLTPDGRLVAHSELGFVVSGRYSPSRRTSYEYDLQGRVSRQDYAWTEPGDHDPASTLSRTSYCHDSSRHHLLTVQHTDALGATTSRLMDTATGLPLSETDASGHTTRFTHDALGRKTSVVDPLGHTTGWVYDDAACTTTIHHPNGYQVTLRHDGFGQWVSHADNAGPQKAQRTLYRRTYDSLGRLDCEQGILGDASVLAYAYDARGRLSQLTDALGNVRSHAYDDVAGTQTEFYNGIRTRTLHFDDHRNVIKEEVFPAPSGSPRVTTTGYDGQGRVVFTQLGDGSASGITRQLHRDVLGDDWKTETRGGDGTMVVRTDERDLLGNVIRTTKTLTAAHRTVSAQSPTYRYDATGLLVQSLHSLGQGEAFSYDANGNLETQTDFAGNTFRHEYDAAGALVRKTFSDAGTRHRFEYSHDASNHRLLSVEHFADDQSQGRIQYTYQDDGKVTSVRYQPGDRQLQWQYDPETNQLVRFTDAAGVVTHFRYTANGQLLSMGPVTGTTDAVTFSHYTRAEAPAHSGKVKSISFANGVSVAYDYDGFGRIGTATARAPALSPTNALVCITYTYDDTTGNLTRKVLSSPHEPQDPSLNHQVAYQYNGIGQLTQEEVSTPEGGLLTRRTYGYDAAGNVVQRTLRHASAEGETTTFQYDADNKLIAVLTPGIPERRLSYDSNGNLVEDGAGRTFGYNALGQLTAFEAAGARFSYTYHPDGLRASKQESAATPVHYYYDQNPVPNLINEVQGSTSASYQLSGAVRFTRRVEGSGMQALLHDQGHVVASLLGQTLSRSRFSAYGELDASTGGSDTGSFRFQDNPFGFAGEYRDAESGLYYLRARYYDPHLMRFLSRDSAVMFNRYSYCSGNPVMLVDPSGNAAWWQWLTMGAAVMAGIAATIATAGALSGAAAGLIAGSSTLVTGAINVGIAATAGVAGAIASNAITAIGNSWGENKWGPEQFFNKNLGIDIGLGAVAGALGSSVTQGGVAVAKKLAGETGRLATASKALAGFVGGAVESTFEGSTLELAKTGEVDWKMLLASGVGGGGMGGVAGQFSDEIKQFAKRFIKLPHWSARYDLEKLRAPAVGGRMEPKLTAYRKIDVELDAPVPNAASGDSAGTAPHRWASDQGENTSAPVAFLLFR
jgi:RHS repeat-associated protein